MSFFNTNLFPITAGVFFTLDVISVGQILMPNYMTETLVSVYICICCGRCKNIMQWPSFYLHIIVDLWWIMILQVLLQHTATVMSAVCHFFAYKKKYSVKIGIQLKRQDTSKCKTTSILFYKIQLDHHIPLFLCRLIEIEEMGIGKEVQFSAI